MKRNKIKTALAAIPIVLSTLMPAGLAKAEPSKPSERVRVTQTLDNDKRSYEVGIGQNAFNESIKLKLVDPKADGSADNHVLGLKAPVPLANAETDLYLTGATQNDEFGLETDTQIDDTRFHLAYSRNSTDQQYGFGLEQKIGQTTLCLGVDLVETLETKEAHYLISAFHQLNETTDFGGAYSFSKIDGSDKHTIAGFASHGGLNVKLGGRTWVKSEFVDGNVTTNYEIIVGQNLVNPYTKFIARRTGFNADSFAHNLGENLFGNAIIENGTFDKRVSSGLAARVHGTVKSAEQDSYIAEMAYIIPVTDEIRLTPMVKYDSVKGEGLGLDLVSGFNLGNFQLRGSVYGDSSYDLKLEWTIPLGESK